MASSILLVEDDLYLSQGLTELLQKSGYVPCQAQSLSQARQAVQSRNFDLLILDVTLPDGDGISFCRELRASGCAAPILFLTARDEEFDIVTGLDAGGNDYVTKPFGPAELVARVDALHRRVNMVAAAQPVEDSSEIRSGPFVLNERSRTLTKNGQNIDLTQVEFQIMECFLKNPNVALERNTVLSKVWGENYFGDAKIVDVNIRRLRMKIEDEPSNPKYLTTVWGYGYKWSVHE